MRASPRTAIAPLLVVLVTLLTAAASAQDAIPHDVTGNGGGMSIAGSLYLHDTIGQPAIGVTTGGTTAQKAGYWYTIDALHIGPTSAVTIVSFTANFIGDGVDLIWAIGESRGLMGFNVYRSEADEGGFKKLNETLIPARDGTGYRDSRVRPEVAYHYQIGAVDLDGEFMSQVITVVTPPARLRLYQNYPNPFNPATTLSFYLPQTERVVLTIHDVSGRVVRRLIDNTVSYGRQDVVWDGRNDAGLRVGSGLYFYRLQAGNRILTRKLTVLK